MPRGRELDYNRAAPESLREKTERLITSLEDASQMATKLPVSYTFHNGGTIGQDMMIGIPVVYWDVVVAALNDLVEELDA
jgi:hypothetical protein